MLSCNNNSLSLKHIYPGCSSKSCCSHVATWECTHYPLKHTILGNWQFEELLLSCINIKIHSLSLTLQHHIHTLYLTHDQLQNALANPQETLWSWTTPISPPTEGRHSNPCEQQPELESGHPLWHKRLCWKPMRKRSLRSRTSFLCVWTPIEGWRVLITLSVTLSPIASPN